MTMSFTLTTGTRAPEFELPGSDGRSHSFAGADAVHGLNGTLIFFTCNHCPYVVGSEERMKALYEKCQSQGISMVAVHSNETKDHPSDSFDQVLVRMREMGFKWLSLNDETQSTAHAFGAERTPHYFLFGKDGNLFYSGRADNSPRDASKAQTHELEDAIADLLAGRPTAVPRTDAIGCNIKWWDREKHWMPKDSCDLDYLYQRETPAKG
jgi:peroxiredoxin